MNEHLPDDQSDRNVANACRVLALLKSPSTLPVEAALLAGDFSSALTALDGLDLPNPDEWVPAPQVVARAEIVNAIRYAR